MRITKYHLPGDVAYTGGSEFSDAVSSLIRKERIMSVVETGTYLGMGTTMAVASGIEDVPGAVCATIECSPAHYRRAIWNLSSAGALGRIVPLLGLSVPRSILPRPSDIVRDYVVDDSSDVFVDHDPEERAELYHKETDFPGVPDDLLSLGLSLFGGRPGLVLLDSAGHMGIVEFEYLMRIVPSDHSFFLALDDINHVKHDRTIRRIESDKRFSILFRTNEKFGSCVARFDP